MGRARQTNLELPKRVYIDGGQYVLMPRLPIVDPRDGQTKTKIRLGSVSDGLEAMLATYNAIMLPPLDKRSVRAVCLRYIDERLGEFGDNTKKVYKAYLLKVAAAFADFTMDQIDTCDWADYLAQNYAGHANSANKVSRLMKKVFRFAISKGLCASRNPLDQIDMHDHKTRQRTVLATPEQIKAIRMAARYGTDGRKTYAGDVFAAMVDMAYLLLQRAIDIRMLREDQINAAENVILIKPTKTDKTSGKSVAIEITPGIADVIERARAIKRKKSIVSPYLFPSRKGTPYAQQSLNSAWDRAKERAGMADVDVTFRDIRSMAATYAKRSGATMDEIRARLVHATVETTEIYIKEETPERSSMDAPIPWFTKAV